MCQFLFSVCKLQANMQFPLIILLKLMLIDFLHGQNSCKSGFCHPSIGDLLVGRSEQLMATSTCGLSGPQKYCIISYLEHEHKCFTCDSRYPYHPVFQVNSHLIENVISAFQPDRRKWWQSENGLDHVSIQLDLESVFQFSHLVLTFKSFRPAAMLVERSADYGQTWKVFRYFAHDCGSSFPGIPPWPARAVGDVVCDSKYSDIEPSTEGEVIFKALDPSYETENPYDPYIQELIAFTNLRINFTKLHTLGDTLFGQKNHEPLEKYYYALYEMAVHGTCFCSGHAKSCGPIQYLRGDVFHEPRMVHGKCLCEHNTEGLNCERCKEFYNDVPWRPAEGEQESACQKCECNGHSESCHFDMAVYLMSNRVSGGVCEDCQHNTMGQHCDRCKPFFYQDPQRTISDPAACISCDCEPEGSVDSGMCESHTDLVLGTIAGQCLCKENVEGTHCDKCKPNYFGLNASNPLGCQACNCNPIGSLPFSTCNPLNGECLCQLFASGQHCEECPQGYWGLGTSVYGCSPCDCDIGGAHNNLCATANGQCECLPNIVGQQCTEPAGGYFFLALDCYIYEAEESVPLFGSSPLGSLLTVRNSALDIVIRESTAEKPQTWSGLGFVRVQNGAGLRFTINNIPLRMDFNIIIRYEPQTEEDWLANINIKSVGTVGNQAARNNADLKETYLLSLPPTSRIELLPTPVCLEPGTEYLVDIHFSKSSSSEPNAQSSILIDSLGLIPQISSLENFCNKQELEDFRQYHCVEIASEIGPHILPEVCAKLIASLSARIHNGAIACRCHPQGSINSDCEKLGGQCQCKPNVIGRCCDKCAAGSHSFGAQGCLPCDCHPQGSVSALCDQLTGHCSCRPDVSGQQCNQCLAGYFGFPHCRPCSCNGFTELCDPQMGTCMNCRGFTTGDNCESCLDGYYGNPRRGVSCRPCMCPDSPTSNRYFAHSCYQDPSTLQLVCNCFVGYSGDQCDQCPNGFYRNPKTTVGQCLPCFCNNNIDVTDPDSCSKDTGECLKCLYNTYGPNCEVCKPGYFGSALLRNCRKCNCNPLGVNSTTCLSGNGFCVCDQSSGACPCLPNVMGHTCDQCAPGYWKMIYGTGCHPCDCHPKHSQNNMCNQLTGQCLCKLGYTGRSCDMCEENYYGDPRINCNSCKCSKDGTLTPGCDKDTGACNCRGGVTGRFCDQCARGYNQPFPSCSRCHVCFYEWDNAITSLSRKIQMLMRFAATLGDKKNIVPVCDIDLRLYEDTISKSERILKSPVLSPGLLLNVKESHDHIRQKVSQMNQQSDFVDQFPDLSRVIEDAGKEADYLTETLRKKSELHHRINHMQLQDSLNKIRNCYQTILSAEERMYGTNSFLTYSMKTRSDILVMLEDFVLKQTTALEQLKLLKAPSIQNLNEKICGVPGNLPCVIAACGGALCRDSPGSKHCGGPGCNGAFPLSATAAGKAHETAMLLKNLTNRMQGSENKVESIRKMTEDTRKETLQINGELKKIKTQIEKEGENIQELIKKLKNFLLEESAPPEDIEKVANYVLGITLPGTPQERTNVLNKLKNLMTHCEDSPTYLSDLYKEMEKARELLVTAEETEKETKRLQIPDDLINNLEDAENVQEQTRSHFAKLKEKIEESAAKIYEAGNQINKTDMELLDFLEKQSELENETAVLRNRMQNNRNQATNAKTEAERAQDQAMVTQKEFSNLKKEYANFQENFKAKRISPQTLEKLNQLKKDAEKLAKEAEEKMKRISDLQNKIQNLNQIKQIKADQLKQLEDHVIAIKNEITEQSNKYASCKT